MTASSTPNTNTPPSSLVMNGNGQPVIMNGGSPVNGNNGMARTGNGYIGNGGESNGRLSNGTISSSEKTQSSPTVSASSSATAGINAGGHNSVPAVNQKSLKKRPADFFTLILKNVFIIILHLIVSLYTYTTLPIYWLIQRPWNVLDQCTYRRAAPMDSDERKATWVSSFPTKYNYVLDHVNTIDELISEIGNYFNLDRRALGYRRVLREHVIMGPDGKTPLRIDGRPVKKRELSDYIWISYEEMIKRKNLMARGFHLNGVQQRDRMVILCETCPEYLMVELALANAGAVQVNVFSTLGDSGIAHAIRETGSKFIFTSFELLHKIRSIIVEYELNVEKVFYITRRCEEISDDEQIECDRLIEKMGNVEFISLVDVECDGERRGHEVEHRCKPIDKDEVAFISKFLFPSDHFLV